MSPHLRDRERFSAAQCRAARGLLGWTAERLAEAASLDAEAVELYEAGEGELAQSDLTRLGAALRRHGVIAVAERLAGEGVRFSVPLAESLAADRDYGRAVAEIASGLAASMSLTAALGGRYVR